MSLHHVDTMDQGARFWRGTHYLNPRHKTCKLFNPEEEAMEILEEAREARKRWELRNLSPGTTARPREGL